MQQGARWTECEVMLLGELEQDVLARGSLKRKPPSWLAISPRLRLPAGVGGLPFRQELCKAISANSRTTMQNQANVPSLFLPLGSSFCL